MTKVKGFTLTCEQYVYDKLVLDSPFRTVIDRDHLILTTTIDCNDCAN